MAFRGSQLPVDVALAKPDVSLVDHSLAVLREGALLCDRQQVDGELRVRALLACALHDVGKAIQEFQGPIRSGQKSRFPHALASFPVVLAVERCLNSHGGLPPCHFPAAAAVLSHHSPLTVDLYRTWSNKPHYLKDEIEALLRVVWPELELHSGRQLPSVVQAWKAILQARCFCVPPVSLLFANHRMGHGVLKDLDPHEFAVVKTILVIADWMVSSNRSRVSSLFLGDVAPKVRSALHGRGYRVRQFQQECERVRGVCGAIALAAPTGTGKTEGLLLWADGADRILYLLPTRATSNAMWHRLRHIFGDEATGIAHASATYVLRRHLKEQMGNDPDFEDEVRDRRLFARVFGLPVVVGTLDQLLIAGLHGRHWELRQTHMRRAAVVVDELGAYDAFTFGVLCKVLELCPPARLAVASATLPDVLLELLPLPDGSIRHIYAEPTLWNRRRHRIELIDEPLHSLAPRAAQDAETGKNVLVVANTVRQALEVYERIKSMAGPGTTVYLLHSRFTERDRLTKEQRICTPLGGTVLVATQVVEVSLDISYDVLYTELCPLDSLVQRLGRVNRYGQQPPARAYVATCVHDATPYVYPRDVLRLSAEILHEASVSPTDRDWLAYSNDFYRHIVKTKSWSDDYQEGAEFVDELHRKLGTYTIDLDDDEQRALFRTRKGTMNVNVLPDCFYEEARAARDERHWERVAELQVPVPVYWLLQFPSRFFYDRDLRCYVTKLGYSDETGIEYPHTAGEADAAIID